MKKITIIGLSLLLAACSSGNYVTEVTSDSYKEDYKPKAVTETMTASKMTEEVVEQKVVQQAPTQQTNMVRVTHSEPTMKPEARAKSNSVQIIAPTPKQVKEYKRFGFTIQVIAVDSSTKAVALARKLPQGHSVWENYKQVNGTDWYTLLYGDYATRSEAQSAIATLPKMFKDLRPFVKSLDDVKNSPYPKLTKLR